MISFRTEDRDEGRDEESPILPNAWIQVREVNRKQEKRKHNKHYQNENIFDVRKGSFPGADFASA